LHASGSLVNVSGIHAKKHTAGVWQLRRPSAQSRSSQPLWTRNRRSAPLTRRWPSHRSP